MLTLQEAVSRLDDVLGAFAVNDVPPPVRELIELVVVLAEVERLRGEQPREPAVTASTLTKPQQQTLMLFGVNPRMDELPDTSDVSIANAQMVGIIGDNIVIGPGGTTNPRGEMTKDEALVLAAYLVALADNSDGRFASIYHRIANT